MQLNHFAIGAGPNLAALFANNQVFVKVSTIPLLYPVQNLVSRLLLNASSSPDMRVNGSVTPVVFEYVVPSTNFFAFAQLNIIIVDTTITPIKFGGQPALTNGILIQVLDADNVVKYDFSPSGLAIKANYQFYHISGTEIAQSTGQDFVAITWQSQLLGVLNCLEPGWKIRLTVRDNLTGMVQFQASVHGALLTNDVKFAI